MYSRACLLVLAFCAAHGLAAPAIQSVGIDSPSSQDHQMLRRYNLGKPKFDVVSRSGGHHIQQITAGKKIDLDGKDHNSHMLFGAGEGVDIYILDSGVRTTHIMFGAKDSTRASNFNYPTTPYTRIPKTVNDEEGHGTHVAGIAAGHKAGVAQWANIINVKVGCKNPKICEGETALVIDAIKDITKKHNGKKELPSKNWKGSVINCSFGLPANHKILNKAIDAAYDAGIAISVAAGNKEDGTTVDATGTLCGSQNTICVGGVEKDYKKGYFSRGGSLVDIWAPGSDIISAGKDSDFDRKVKTGTSMATGVVSGIMAIIIGYESLNSNARLVYDRVYANAIPNIVGGLSKGEKNVFAQTGIANGGDHPYQGPGDDFNPLVDPYGPGFYRKRALTESRDSHAVEKRFNDAEIDGYKAVKVEDDEPNDDKPTLITQEQTFQVDEAGGGTEVEEMPIISDDQDTGASEDTGPSTGPPLVNGKPICDGNQVQHDCVGGVLPHVNDYSGPQAPTCMKADGSPGSSPRLNTDELRSQASAYCKKLVDSRWLLKEGANPNPAVLPGKAEKGASMVLAVMYNKGSCPKDKSKSEMDFGTLGVDKCVEYLSDTLSHACSMDSSWAAWNKDFEVMGGVWATDCAMFTVMGQ